jgi:CDGSH iron-sulfur domain-containing protein 3
MSEPVVARKSPYAIELEPGKYWWCACGRSSNQPFCDGSHQGTGFSPVEFEIHEKDTVWLCGCKHTAESPHCDGTHAVLPD